MKKTRRKISACYKDFLLSVNYYESKNIKNQQDFSLNKTIDKKQLIFLTETIFFYTYRSYENYIREIFILFCLGNKTLTGKKVISYLNTKNFIKAETIIKSQRPFINWSNPGSLIEISGLYLKNGYPIKDPITSYFNQLRDYKSIRDHIAHNSFESQNSFEKILHRVFRVKPLLNIEPGELLLTINNKKTGNYYLIDFFTDLKSLSYALING
jgi:hypothetical protein